MSKDISIAQKGAFSPVPFAKRVSALFSRPCLRRLKTEPEPGWMTELFPGTTCTRWSHTLGAFSAIVLINDALLSDPGVPTYRLFANADELCHVFVSAILDDLGQSADSHDFEGISRALRHEQFVLRLLDDETWGPYTLRKALQHFWPDLSAERVFRFR